MEMSGRFLGWSDLKGVGISCLIAHARNMAWAGPLGKERVKNPEITLSREGPQHVLAPRASSPEGDNFGMVIR
jgi:hypothetical protein